VTLEERGALLDRGTPGGEVGFELGALAVLVRMLELVEGGVFRVEQLAVTPAQAEVVRSAVPSSTAIGPTSVALNAPPV